MEVLGADKGALPTFYRDGRAYVLGSIGQRYRVHIENPTSRADESHHAPRVEPVVQTEHPARGL